MHTQTATLAPSGSIEQLAADAIAELTKLLQDGLSIDLDAFIAEHPECADRLRELAPTMQILLDLGYSATDLPLRAPAEGRSGEGGVRGSSEEAYNHSRTLGDFRILREIGRGGMGVVYEAEQISLGRRVALKVLPFASMLDERQLQRFKNEARAAATLHHPNIVPVYSVGCERGVHFYAMQYIEGQTLAAVIDGLKDEVRSTKDEESRSHALRGNGSPAAPRRESRGRVSPRRDPESQRDSATCMECGDSSQLSFSNDAGSTKDATVIEIQIADKSPHSTDTIAAALSTLRTERPKDFYRRIAEIGIQAAEALDHAHQLGIVHRDIKPANLLVETQMRNAECGMGNEGRGNSARSTIPHSPFAIPRSAKLFIADFGLARLPTDAGMTMTGDLLGTLRYMSPEQAEGKSAILDHRTDIYSLGVTLYELLALRPAFPATERQTLLNQIANDDPPAPRKLNKSIPADLETIVLKCCAKDPHSRYQSAQHLADDLRCYLAQQPVKARRPSVLDRSRRWVSRHAAIVSGALVTLALVAASGVAATILTLQAWQSEADERTKAEENLRLAAESIDQMLTRVAERRYTQGDMEFAESLAADATRLYERLLIRSDDPELTVKAANALVQVAHIQIRLGEHEQAQDAYARASELLTPLTRAFPERDDYVCALAAIETGQGEALYSLGRHAEAEAPYRRALSIAEQLARQFPNNATHQISLADRFNNLGVVYTFTDRLDLAEHCYEQSAEIEKRLPKEISESLEALDRQSCLLLNWASLARERGEYDRAIDMLERGASGRGLVLAASPAHPGNRVQSYNHYWNLAYTYVQANRHEEGAATVEKMVAAFPDWLQANHEGARLLLRCAEQCSRHAPRAVPHSESAVYNALADAYRQRARELLAKALTAPVRNPDTIDRLAWFLLTCPDESFRDPPAALKLSQAAVKEVPKRPTAWYTLALAHYRNGELKPAEDAQQKSIELFGGVANAYNWALVSMIRFQQGQISEANRLHERAHRSLDENQKKDGDLVELIAESGRLVGTGDTEATK